MLAFSASRCQKSTEIWEHHLSGWGRGGDLSPLENLHPPGWKSRYIPGEIVDVFCKSTFPGGKPRDHASKLEVIRGGSTVEGGGGTPTLLRR